MTFVPRIETRVVLASVMFTTIAVFETVFKEMLGEDVAELVFFNVIAWTLVIEEKPADEISTE